jgi:hypothetical protein
MSTSNQSDPSQRSSLAEVSPDGVEGARPFARMRVESLGDLGAWLLLVVREMAVVDWLCVVYFHCVLFALAIGNGPGRADCARTTATQLAVFVFGMMLTRGQILRPGTTIHGLAYRASLYFACFLSYFMLKEILPAVSTRTVDASIFAFDLRVFGFEPSLLWDRYVTVQTTEWFAFFYFGYFFLLALHVLPIMLATKDMDVLTHFCLGIFLVFFPGHLIYMMVPGYGPHTYLAGEFHNELHGGLFWALVEATVKASGAQKDIFPSLHTAAPTFFAIFGWYHRDRMPFRVTWPLVALFASQIIIATMFLRWHYLIDIFAGLALATFAAVVSRRVTIWEQSRRARLRRTPTFQAMSWRDILGN